MQHAKETGPPVAQIRQRNFQFRMQKLHPLLNPGLTNFYGVTTYSYTVPGRSHSVHFNSLKGLSLFWKVPLALARTLALLYRDRLKGLYVVV